MEFGRPDNSEDDKKADLPSNAAVERPVFHPFIPEAILRGGLEVSERKDEDDDGEDEKEGKKSGGQRRLRSLLPIVHDAPKESATKKDGVLEPMRGQYDLPVMNVHQDQADQMSAPTAEASYESMADSGAALSDLNSEHSQRMLGGHEAPLPDRMTALEAMLKKYTQAENNESSENSISVRSTADRAGDYVAPIIQDSEPQHVMKPVGEVHPNAEVDTLNRVTAENELESREAPLPSIAESTIMTTPLETVSATRISRAEISPHGGAGLLALIGVEAGFRYLGDRKSRRIARKGDANLQKQINTTNEAQKDMASGMDLSRRRSEQLDRRRDEFERRAAKAFERQQRQVKEWKTDRAVQQQPERSPSAPNSHAQSEALRDEPRAIPSVEVAPRQEVEAVEPRVKLVPETDKFVEVQAKPKVVMEQVAIAAEQDVPLERVYERRQEIKDDPSSGPQASGGAGNANHDQPVLQTSVLPPSSTQYRTNADLSTSHNVKPDQYNTATRNGVVAAVIIIFAILAYLFMR